MSGVVSKKLKFKGDKPKKKKRSHAREGEDDGEGIAALAAGDPRGEFFGVLGVGSRESGVGSSFWSLRVLELGFENRVSRIEDGGWDGEKWG